VLGGHVPALQPSLLYEDIARLVKENIPSKTVRTTRAIS
jgi:hypothetical protein